MNNAKAVIVLQSVVNALEAQQKMLVEKFGAEVLNKQTPTLTVLRQQEIEAMKLAIDSLQGESVVGRMEDFARKHKGYEQTSAGVALMSFLRGDCQHYSLGFSTCELCGVEMNGNI